MAMYCTSVFGESSLGFRGANPVQCLEWSQKLDQLNARMPVFFPNCILNQEELRVPTRSWILEKNFLHVRVCIAPWLLYICIASRKKLGSCLFQGLYWLPICNLESEKIGYCFGRSLEKVWNFGSKNLYQPRELHIKKLQTVGSLMLLLSCHYIQVC